MINLYSVESPFMVYEIFLQLFFALITFIISFISFKVFRITQRKNPKYMLTGFLLISFSYVVQALFNFFKILGYDYEKILVLGIHPLAIFQNQSVYVHIFLMTIGLSFLLLTTFKHTSRKLLLIILTPSLLSLFFSEYLLKSFFLITSLYLGFLFHHYLLNYLEHKNIKPLLIAFAFFFLFLGQVEFVFMGASVLMYIIANIFNFLAYLFILGNFYLIMKK